MPRPEETALSICVIGENEAENLPRLLDSLEAVKNLPITSETIYVDSASTDNSVEIAKKGFDAIYELEPSENLCAAAGRHIGTLRARGDWILYLDGDMVLCGEFLQIIVQKCKEKPFDTGWLGKYRYIDGAGVIRENALGSSESGKVVSHFGGAILLPRHAVLGAGNWNPGVFSNEEIDLYTRLRGAGCVVRFADSPMIEHQKQDATKLEKFLGMFVPQKFLGKKFYGFGQLLAARVKSNTIVDFIRFFPYPFVYWFSLLAAIIFGLASMPVLAVLSFLAGIGVVWYKKRMHFVVLYTGFIIQALMGWSRYNADYKPKIKASWER